ncbi:hypothetical protein EJ08DRAFT_694674 [Tothia fuscella]|uniref:Uncharacterized protein n=1 Tax=Tothia fuscella TaxID=1048955 RepID=A0A9P4NXG1_9PEZI|nr:hypothetical protein EJ08DRAFT_694674 [Tothia fuscella]
MTEMAASITALSDVPQLNLQLPFHSLDNEIHPLLQAHNWRQNNPHDEIEGTAIIQWLRIVSPALQLASLYISTDCLLEWWSHLFFAAKRRDDFTGKIYLSTEHSINEKRDMTNETKDKLLKMAISGTKFSFTSLESAWGTSGVAYEAPDGYMAYIVGDKMLPWRDDQWTPTNLTSRRTEDFKRVYTIELDTWWLHYGLNEFSKASTQNQVTYLYGLAKLICHELAHSAWLHVDMGPKPDFQRVGPEPFHQSYDPTSHLGDSWESSMLPKTKEFLGEPLKTKFKKQGKDIHLLRGIWAPPRPGRNETYYLQFKRSVCWISLLSLFSSTTWEKINTSGNGMSELHLLFDPEHKKHSVLDCRNGKYGNIVVRIGEDVEDVRARAAAVEQDEKTKSTLTKAWNAVTAVLMSPGIASDSSSSSTNDGQGGSTIWESNVKRKRGNDPSQEHIGRDRAFR